MTTHMQVYLLAWDWLLYAMYAFIWFAAIVGVLAVIWVEYDNNRRPK